MLWPFFARPHLVVPQSAQGLTTQTAQLPNSANLAYPGDFTDGTTALNQCMAEQEYVRGSMTRTLLYSQARPL